jgi:transcriptional regulator with XRE-family HTH domain
MVSDWEIAERIGPEFKAARERKGWTQTQAALEIGCSATEVGAYENARKTPSFSRFLQICKVYGLNPGKLMVLAATK